MPYNAANLHASLIAHGKTMLDGSQNYGGGILDSQVDSQYSGGRTITVRQHLASRPANRQFEYDAALWYGAIAHPGANWHTNFLLRAFGVLFHGDLLYYSGPNSWSHWAMTDIPIVSTISHTARVVIQLGKANSPSAGFWAWLWGGQPPVTRAAATHGVEDFKANEDIHVGTRSYTKVLKEVKGNKGGVSHFGVNVALGGAGYLNPVSGKPISGNGKHGHFYMAYKAPTTTTNGVVLMATEQSCPLDVYTPHEAGSLKTGLKKVGMFFKAVATMGVPDQYGGYHGFGGHSRFSATGGDDWTKDKLAGVGPQRYYDGMFVDLTKDYNRVITAAGLFTDDLLGYPGQLSPLPQSQPIAIPKKKSSLLDD
jgi:hypothetical protein